MNFLLIESTKRNLEKFTEYQKEKHRTEKFFGEYVNPDACRKLIVKEGETVLIPSGYIHARYMPTDSIVFGGYFLHTMHTSKQIE